MTFRENQRVNRLYRADIKLENVPQVIMLSSDRKQPGRFAGIDALKTSWLDHEASESYEVKYISVEQWTSLNKDEKLRLLQNLVGQKLKKL